MNLITSIFNTWNCALIPKIRISFPEKRATIIGEHGKIYFVQIGHRQMNAKIRHN